METSTAPISAGTRARIMEAALETLRTDGIVGASARTIASRGGFNQALIFYHFGSVRNLLMQAAAAHSAEAVARYRERAEGVVSLADLVDLARRLHYEDHESSSVTVVTQLMAGATHDPELARSVMDAFDRWIEVVETALRRVIAGTGAAELIPIREAAYAIASMFLGLELMSRLDPDRGDPEALFTMMANLAFAVEGLLQGPSDLPSRTNM
jgi:AcrR family transcriptional regulator